MIRDSNVVSNNIFSKTESFFILFLCCLTLLLWYTVFSRPVTFQPPQLELFWSYKKWLAGDWGLGWEILGNIVMFIPFGFLLAPCLFLNKNRFILVLIAGILFSCLIEILQLELWRGLFEYDDIFNNALGTVLGYWLYGLAPKLVPTKYV